jgi:hypothetical protein
LNPPHPPRYATDSNNPRECSMIFCHQELNLRVRQTVMSPLGRQPSPDRLTTVCAWRANAARVSLIYCDIRCALRGRLMTITYTILPCHRSQCCDKVSVFYLFLKLTYTVFPFNGSIIRYLTHILYHGLTSLIVRLRNAGRVH